MTRVLGVEFVYVIQEEDSIAKNSHFHVWLFPRMPWMERFGKGISSVKPIMEHARERMKTKNVLKEVREAALKIKRELTRS